MLNRYKISKCQFTINPNTSYSSLHITSPITFDNFGHINPNGLYDLRLGPLNITQTCHTCNQNIVKCPSHFGHIELKIPVINPLTLDTLVIVLNAICTHCHFLRHDMYTLSQFINKDFDIFNNIYDLNEHLSGIEYEPKLCDINAVINFLKDSPLKCAHCSYKNTRYKIDKTKTIMQKKILCVEYLYNLIRISYTKCQWIYKFMFNGEFEPRSFFLFELPVMPNKFRPANVINGRMYENGINATYIKILKLNESNEFKKPKNNRSIKNNTKDIEIEHGMDTNMEIKKSNIKNKHNHIKESEKINDLKTDTKNNRNMNSKKDINNSKGNKNYLTQSSDSNSDVESCDSKEAYDSLSDSIIEDNLTTLYNNTNLPPSIYRNPEGYIIDPAYLNTYILLQRYVYLIFDSSIKSKTEMALGIKQILEKKDGLFRKNMMGKRVNHSARSVISPDPNLHTREIGIPDIFASKFTFPTLITDFNIEKYRNEVVQRTVPKLTIDNVTYDTSYVPDLKLYELSCKLKVGCTVYRTMCDNDVVLVNRQPTLHKPSIMAHRVKILKNEKTIRMHYANCNSYNADFDGDEINIHFLQDEVARAEAYMLMSTDHNYCLEAPVRGLVQDHISVAVRMCTSYYYDISMFIVEANNTKVDECKFDNYLKHERSGDEEGVMQKYYVPEPCLIRPVRLYSGLQIVTSILKSMNLNIDFTGKCKLDNSEVIVRDGHLLKGIIDKNQIGPSRNGLIHYCGIKYGMSVCNELLTTFGRVMNKIMVSDGFSARIDDLLLVDKGNVNRSYNIEDGKRDGLKTGTDELCYKSINNNYIKGNNESIKNLDFEGNNESINNLEMEGNNESINNLDFEGKYNNFSKTENINHKDEDKQKRLNSGATSNSENKNNERYSNDKVNTTNIPYTIKMKDPYYYKDSNILEHLDSITKKTMNEYTTNIISSITTYQQKLTNNFTIMILSGAKGSLVNLGQISGLLGQQELEGKRPPLMESNTTLPSVRSNSFRPQDYGFIFERFADGINANSYFFHCMAGREGLIDTAVKTARSGYLQRCLVKTLEDCRVENDLSVRMNGYIVQFMYGEDGVDPVQYNSYQDGIVCNNNLTNYNTNLEDNVKVEEDRQKYNIQNYNIQKDDSQNDNIHKDDIHNKNMHRNDLMSNKLREECRPSLVTPGEAVGIIAAQSVGEPSTQMTLNTFHLAGVGSKNVTLGIPRLVEIIMVAQKNIKTPYITVELKNDFDLATVKRVTLNDVINRISIEEQKNEYKITMETESPVSKGIIKQIVALLDKLSKKKKITGIVADDVKEDSVEEEADLQKDESESSSEALSDLEEEEVNDIKDPENKDLDNTDCEISDEDVFEEAEKFKKQCFDQPNKIENKFKKEPKTFVDKKKDQMTNCLSFTYSTTQKDILILPYLEKIMPLIIIKQWPGIKNAAIHDNKLTLEGSCLKSLVDLLSVEELNTMYTNDIYYISQFLGIEAARTAIIEEITHVFEVYGITINIRHLMLIADLMTRDGVYKPCSRNGMKDKSIIQRMCFESCYSHLKRGVIFNETDYVENVSSELVLGRNVSMGTQGCFDLLYELPDD